MTKHSERARREFVSVVELIVLAFVIGIPVAAPLMPARAATNHVIGMWDFYYTPHSQTVAPGDTVQWRNYGAYQHTAKSNASAWTEVVVNPGVLSSPATVMPSTPGTYSYICSNHFATDGMWGEIIVSTVVPEFSSSLVVVVGLLVMALGLMLVRRKL